MSQPVLQTQRTGFPVPAEAANWQKTWLIVGIVGALGCVAGLVMQPEQLLRGYLIGFMIGSVPMAMNALHRTRTSKPR